jgi:predicted MFS family arabinose efflux permease
MGAALGGVVTGAWGIYPAFVIDALTFLISAWLIFHVDYPDHAPLEDAEKNLLATLRQYTEGLRYLKGHVDISVIALLKAASELTISGAFQVVQVALAEQIFVIGEGGGISLGILYAVVGVGTGLGPILARRFTGDRDRPLRVAIIVAYGLAACGLAIIGTLQSFGLVLFGALLRGVGSGINWVFSTQLLLQLVPDQVRGRVFATEFAAMTLMSATGAAVGGWLLDSTTLGVRGMSWGMAALGLVPGALWAAWVLFGRRSNPRNPPQRA